MEKQDKKPKMLRYLYQNVVVRFKSQIREPYLIRIDNIYPNPKTKELTIAFHIANKRVNEYMTVAEFVKTDMIYLIDPRIVFDLGQQYGSYSEKLVISDKENPSVKSRCITTLKRVFIDG